MITGRGTHSDRRTCPPMMVRPSLPFIRLVQIMSFYLVCIFLGLLYCKIVTETQSGVCRNRKFLAADDLSLLLHPLDRNYSMVTEIQSTTVISVILWMSAGRELWKHHPLKELQSH